MHNFFPMSRGDFLYLGLLASFSVVSFLPWARSISWGGMAMQGWMMALLMVIAPTLALLRLLLSGPVHENDPS